MNISPNQASQALDQISATEAKSSKLYGYSRGAPHLIVWGIVWLVGFGLTAIFPASAALIWSIVTPLGIAAGFIVGRRHDAESGPYDWRYAIIALAFAAFFFAAFSVIKPHNANQVGAFICLVVGLIYVVMGLWLGTRYIVAGLLVTALTLAGFFLMQSYFSAWMAVLGGGALIVMGLWLRKP
ncbi:hypothetical protein GJW-30_1_04141 [Variibacter gotjawalensis]|uniref:Uncharacterized protein n=1 Tax=Variibacter gotjawalensis TaxID=1333996 RepID=A0A0S3Q0C4_9BRAD|nr:hypothetical protein [Variibacter gotjawalensis]NIK47423.1 hypothetical protein [Variibacter gotjawalensis]RZS49318.1 hypothetical protein EV661_1747 [Variibacter gotjawalensis]BAT61582.1 hypothetical protein GJW-30_1_04141 [Variibacter gotjawalensis]